MGRRKKIDSRINLLETRIEDDLMIAENCLNRFGNASLGDGIISNYTTEEAGEILGKRVGRQIDVRKVVHPGPRVQGKQYPDEVYYIAEDLSHFGFIQSFTM